MRPTIDDLKAVYETPEAIRAAEAMEGSFLCQRVAAMVAKREGRDRTDIYSFNPQSNPDAEYFADDDDDDGHVFAVVDNRYIVDPWVYGLIANNGIVGRSVFDLKSPNDRDIIGYFYGDPNKWVKSSEADGWADDWPV